MNTAVYGFYRAGDEWYGCAKGRNQYAATNGGPVIIDEGNGAIAPSDAAAVPYGCAPGWVRLRLEPLPLWRKNRKEVTQ